MKIFRRPRQVPGPASNRLAVRGRDAQPELAEARVIRVPRPAPGRACLQFVGRKNRPRQARRVIRAEPGPLATSLRARTRRGVVKHRMHRVTPAFGGFGGENLSFLRWPETPGRVSQHLNDRSRQVATAPPGRVVPQVHRVGWPVLPTAQAATQSNPTSLQGPRIHGEKEVLVLPMDPRPPNRVL